MVSPQQMQETDRGPKERNQMRNYKATQDEKISLKKTWFCLSNALYMSDSNVFDQNLVTVGFCMSQSSNQKMSRQDGYQFIRKSD